MSGQSGQFATIVLVAWIPFSLLIAGVIRPVSRAVIFLVLSGWLFLPGISLYFSGIPDYSKFSACSFGPLLGTLAFDARRLFSFRPRWFDLPILLWCVGILPSLLANDLALYDGLSAAVSNLTMYGVPYFLGRVYLTDREAILDLAKGLAFAGLVYAPFCLWEIRMAPLLNAWFYGSSSGWYFEGRRSVLGYRPIVFLSFGLETAMLMCVTALTALWLGWTGAVKSVWGISLRLLSVALAAVAILCQSMGAVLLLAIGLATLFLTQTTKRWAFFLLLVLVPVAYPCLRLSGLWSGRNLAEIVRSNFSDDRAQSLQTRFDNENLLMGRAMIRPLLGWGNGGRSRVVDAESGDTSLTDGYWVIILGMQGLIGLSAATATYLLPVVRIMRKIPARAIATPENASCAALMAVILLQWIDCLSNAFLSPIHLLIVGALTSYNPVRVSQTRQKLGQLLAEADALAEAGELAEAEVYCRQVVEYASEVGLTTTDGCVAAASAFQTLGPLLQAAGRSDEAEESLSNAVSLWETHASSHPDETSSFEALAQSLEALARMLRDQHRHAEALGFWHAALRARQRVPVQAQDPHSAADSYNDLAWHLIFCPDPAYRDASSAVGLAQRAVDLLPDHACYWNTLGAAHYHAANYVAAISTLSHSVELSGGGTAFDNYLLALAHTHLGNRTEAEHWYARGEADTRIYRDHPELADLRSTAAAAVANLAGFTDTTIV